MRKYIYAVGIAMAITGIFQIYLYQDWWNWIDYIVGNT